MRYGLIVTAVMALCTSPLAAAESPPAKAAPREQAKAPSLVCPPAIKVEPQALSGKVEGWRYFADEQAQHTLDTVSFYIQKKSLTKLDPHRGTEVFTEWKFPDNGKEKYFVACSYTRTGVLLKRQLEPGVKFCRVLFESDPARPGLPPSQHKIVCE
jgi:hypothetical protein